MKQFQTGYMAGVYDLFHIGHLNLINRAKEHCEYLIVGVLTDELVYHFKKKYPVIPFEERIRIIEAIKGVDRAVPVTLENIGKMESWKLYHYDVQFSGSDYENAPDWQADKKRLEEVGSTIMFFPYTKETSSTDIRKKLLDSLQEAEAQKKKSSLSPREQKERQKREQIRQVQLALLDTLDGICRRHGFKYFATNGTLLGAVRHQGFIPWDDDLDVAMLRSDYDKLTELAPGEWPEYYFLQTMHSDPGVFYNGIAKLRDSRTTGIIERDWEHPSNQGIWIDIIPIDSCPTDDDKFRKKASMVSRWNLLMNGKLYGKQIKGAAYGLSAAKWFGYCLLAHLLSQEKIAKKLEKAMKAFPEEKGLGIFTGSGCYRQLNAEDFADVIELDFEGRKILAPKGYENYLFMTMGRDYVKLPPSEQQIPKHRGIFDADKPYKEYISYFCNIFDDVKGKKLILFGGGMMFDDYMKKFGRQYRPAFAVDNDAGKWGRQRLGIEIRKPDELLEIPPEKRKIIICSAHYLEIERQLRDMGIDQYSIYVQHIEWICDTERKR